MPLREGRSMEVNWLAMVAFHAFLLRNPILRVKPPAGMPQRYPRFDPVGTRDGLLFRPHHPALGQRSSQVAHNRHGTRFQLDGLLGWCVED